MQRPKRIPNAQRTDATRTALVAAARRLFMEKGYAATGTPEIADAAGLTRGALYHHYEDKSDLFLAVARQAAEEVAHEIERKSKSEAAPLAALLKGADAYFAAMAEAGRARLLLLEAPTILAPARLRELSELAGATQLQEGLRAALPAPAQKAAPLEALTALVSAAFDRAALAIASGEPPARYKAAIRLLLESLARST